MGSGEPVDRAPTCAPTPRPRSSIGWPGRSRRPRSDPKVQEQYRKLGFETVAEGPQETLKRLTRRTDMWRKTIESAGIKVN